LDGRDAPRSCKVCVFIVALVCLPVASLAAPPLRVKTYVSGLSAPVAFVQDPDPSIQYVVEQGGRIRIVQNGVLHGTSFLDLSGAITSGGERGLLGMALAPDYATSGRFYVNFTDQAGNTVVARFRRSANPLIADAGSRFDLRWGGASGPAFIVQPFANHNGGHLAFGPDGFLYVGLGDGGSGGDPGNRAQNPAELLGKMLRIDVSVPDVHPIGYQVPPDNPFVAGGPPGTRPEIWSFGWRNPWRYSFDDPSRGGTGALIIGDVGQNAWEEIDYEPPNRGGRNYGWRNREGAHNFNTSVPPPFLPLVDPIHEYDHGVGSSVTGGYVYRGSALGPAHRGRYFFADFIRGRVWSIGLAINPGTGEAATTDVVEHTSALSTGGALGNISSFGVDADGELMIVSYSRGILLKVVNASPNSGDFDGDGKTDLTIFRPGGANWFTSHSATGYATNTVRQWGLAPDVPAPGDYDGDGRTDLAVYRRSEGVWYILQSSTDSMVTHPLGLTSDLPVPADYDGDGRTDPAVYRRATGVWYILSSSSNYVTVGSHQWGLRGDIPVPSDYDGDGKADLAVYRLSNGTWYILTSSSGLTVGREVQWGLTGDVPVPGDYDGDAVTDIAVYRPGNGMWFIRKSTTDFATWMTFQWGLTGDVPVPGDYDGDRTTDLAVYRSSTGTWHIAHSTSAYASSASYQWGLPGDTPTPRLPLAYALATRLTLATLVRASDFDGDRRSDLTVFRPSNGQWYARRSAEGFSLTTTVQWGLPGDIPVAHDYDSDGQTDFAVYRPSTSVWWILYSLSGYTTSTARQWGLVGDVPVSGDYDGDAIADLAVYRPSTGIWYLLLSTTNYTTSVEYQWGLLGDVPMPGDYDGDTVTDIAVFRPSTGHWFIRYSSTGYGTFAVFQWALPGDVPVPGEYDGDGKTDLAVYRPSTGVWYRLLSSTNFTGYVQHQWGLTGDTPVPGDYDGDRKTDLAVWRPSAGEWYLLKSSTNFTMFDIIQWGLPGDIPILRRP
jgi:glucose/arabinose dehydrogenase